MKLALSETPKTGFLATRPNLKSISCPAQLPDLNIIENTWLYIKRKLPYRHHVINSDSDLIREIKRIWMDIAPAYIQSLYLSVPRRTMSVIRLKGHLTKTVTFKFVLVNIFAIFFQLKRFN